MKIKNDKKIDAKYIKIEEGVITKTKREKDWLFFDCNKKGDVLGIEVLNASKNPINIIVTNGKLTSISKVFHKKLKEASSKLSEVNISNNKFFQKEFALTPLLNNNVY